MAELLFYEQITAIDKDKHRHLRIGEIRDYAFTAKTNSIPLTSVEFFEAAREYPIVFAGPEGQPPVPVCLLGLRNEENLFVTAEGKWAAHYVPAFVRRFPFVLAPSQEQLLVCIDSGHPAVGDANGQALFTQEGEPTPFLQNAIQFLRQFQTEAQNTHQFVQRLQDLGLLQAVSAKAELKTGGSYQLNGFQVVNEARFRALDKDTVDELFRKGWLSLIDAHLLSLGNMNRLIERLTPAA